MCVRACACVIITFDYWVEYVYANERVRFVIDCALASLYCICFTVSFLMYCVFLETIHTYAGARQGWLHEDSKRSERHRGPHGGGVEPRGRRRHTHPVRIRARGLHKCRQDLQHVPAKGHHSGNLLLFILFVFIFIFGRFRRGVFNKWCLCIFACPSCVCACADERVVVAA